MFRKRFLNKGGSQKTCNFLSKKFLRGAKWFLKIKLFTEEMVTFENLTTV